MTFKCQEPKCDREVEFEYEPEEGVLEIRSDKIRNRKPKGLQIVYLTYEDGHTYPYVIEM